MKIFELHFFGITFAPTYYALMYILGFLAAWIFMKKNFAFRQKTDLDNLFFAVGLGVIIGGRLGYVLFYNLSYYLSNPLKILAIWEGGMSFHGGLLGVIIGVFWFAKQEKYNFWNIIDYLAIIAPIGLWLGRIGNYLNNELYGYAPYSGPFAMNINGVSHFPSPLLEMLLEWVLLFILLYTAYSKFHLQKYAWVLSGIFLIGYWFSRIIVEFFRLPDAHIGYILGTNFITVGMLYTLPMIIFGIFLISKNIMKNKKVVK